VGDVTAHAVQSLCGHMPLLTACAGHLLVTGKAEFIRTAQEQMPDLRSMRAVADSTLPILCRQMPGAAAPDRSRDSAVTGVA